MLKTRTLGTTGFNLTEIGFGAWAIGGRRYGPVAESDGIVARTVLESGFLTGKYKPGQTFSGDDHRKRWGGQRLESILQQV